MTLAQWVRHSGTWVAGWGNLLMLLVMTLGALPAGAQYQVYAWYNFDSGRLDANALPIGTDVANRALVVPYSSIPGAPQGFADQTAGIENGPAGLLLKTNSQAAAGYYAIGMASNVILQRSRLGKSGRALFQADFYIPPAPGPAPSLAVLAMDPLQKGKTKPSSFYRFGIAANRDVYFSLWVPGETEAKIYKSDRTMMNQMPRGAWHRFAIVCEGEQNIRCFVDGRETSFSPIQDTSLQNLQVGVMLADKNNDYDAYVDNLSIQWTHEDVPLPDSPWAWTWPGGPPKPRIFSSVAMGGGDESPYPSATSTPGAAPSEITWLDTATGWQRSQANNKPMLVYFQAPRLESTRQMEQLMQSEAARSFLTRHTCVKVDVNQLQGGTYAEKFNIFKVPTLIVFNMQGQEAGRAVFNRNDTWQSFVAKLGQ